MYVSLLKFGEESPAKIINPVRPIIDTKQLCENHSYSEVVVDSEYTEMHEVLVQLAYSFKSMEEDTVDWKILVADALGVYKDDLNIDCGFASVAATSTGIPEIDILTLLDTIDICTNVINATEAKSVNFSNAYLYVACIAAARLIAMRDKRVDLGTLSITDFVEILGTSRTINIDGSEYMFNDRACACKVSDALLYDKKLSLSDYIGAINLMQLNIRATLQNK